MLTIETMLSNNQSRIYGNNGCAGPLIETHNQILPIKAFPFANYLVVTWRKARQILARKFLNPQTRKIFASEIWKYLCLLIFDIVFLTVHPPTHVGAKA